MGPEGGRQGRLREGRTPAASGGVGFFRLLGLGSAGSPGRREARQLPTVRPSDRSIDPPSCGGSSPLVPVQVTLTPGRSTRWRLPGRGGSPDVPSDGGGCQKPASADRSGGGISRLRLTAGEAENIPGRCLLPSPHGSLHDSSSTAGRRPQYGVNNNAADSNPEASRRVREEEGGGSRSQVHAGSCSFSSQGSLGFSIGDAELRKLRVPSSTACGSAFR